MYTAIIVIVAKHCKSASQWFRGAPKWLPRYQTRPYN